MGGRMSTYRNTRQRHKGQGEAMRDEGLVVPTSSAHAVQRASPSATPSLRRPTHATQPPRVAGGASDPVEMLKRRGHILDAQRQRSVEGLHDAVCELDDHPKAQAHAAQVRLGAELRLDGQVQHQRRHLEADAHDQLLQPGGEGVDHVREPRRLRAPPLALPIGEQSAAAGGGGEVEGVGHDAESSGGVVARAGKRRGDRSLVDREAD
mmetsp:Transcript_30351/g.95252  ORF Transcript_30351/g.95252 Transcript_30351/m.95252 type:complete len:208 (-) Transcript_30351:420-1043(-)